MFFFRIVNKSAVLLCNFSLVHVWWTHLSQVIKSHNKIIYTVVNILKTSIFIEYNETRGIEIKLNSTTGNLKISQLAGDTTLFLKSKHEITIAKNIIEEFGNLSGLKLNKNKTEEIWLGRLKHTKDKYENISWTNDPVKSLGVYFGYNKTQ